VFPNPAADYLLVSNSAELKITNIEIFDIAGNLISVVSTDNTVIDISNLFTENYFICFTVDNKKVYRSFIKK